MMAFWLVPTPFTQFISHVYIALRGTFSYIPGDAVDRRSLRFLISFYLAAVKDLISAKNIRTLLREVLRSCFPCPPTQHNVISLQTKPSTAMYLRA